MRQGMEYRARVAADGYDRGGEMRQGMEYRATVAADGYDRGGEMRQGMEYRATVTAGGGGYDRCGDPIFIVLLLSRVKQ
jgi:hypothetical protein